MKRNIERKKHDELGVIFSRSQDKECIDLDEFCMFITLANLFVLETEIINMCLLSY